MAVARRVFPNKKYQIILADPPWEYKDKASAGDRGACFKYDVMSFEKICKLPVKQIAGKDCVLFLWVTMPMLNVCMDVITSWGFKFKTCAFVWVKTNKNNTNTIFWGLGRWTRSNAEICLLATKGKPKRISASVHSIIISPMIKHSRKPPETYELIEQLLGKNKTKIELFARERKQGWDSWGNEV